MSSSVLPAPVAALPDPGSFKPRWIISQSQDLTWFIGSGAVGYLALALMAVGFPVVAL